MYSATKSEFVRKLIKEKALKLKKELRDNLLLDKDK